MRRPRRLHLLPRVGNCLHYRPETTCVEVVALCLDQRGAAARLPMFRSRNIASPRHSWRGGQTETLATFLCLGLPRLQPLVKPWDTIRRDKIGSCYVCSPGNANNPKTSGQCLFMAGSSLLRCTIPESDRSVLRLTKLKARYRHCIASPSPGLADWAGTNTEWSLASLVMPTGEPESPCYSCYPSCDAFRLINHPTAVPSEKTA